MPGDIILRLRHKNHYFIDDVRFLRYRALQTETFVILVHFMFSPPPLLKRMKNKILRKKEKHLGI